MRLPISFWPLQLLGWLGYGVSTATVYSQVLDKPDYLAFRAVLFLGTFLSSFVLREICRRLWRRRVSLIAALAVCVVATLIFGLLCMAPAVWVERRVGPADGPFPWFDVLAGSVGAAVILQGWSALYFGFKNYRMVEDLRLALVTAESMARSAQLQALQYQLQPHFLFNTLNAISSLVVSDQPHQATQMIANLGVLLRSSLDRPEIHTVALCEELATVEEYLAIERVRFGSRLTVSFHIEPQVDVARVPRFLLQPLIENAVRHGIAARTTGGAIVVRAYVADDALLIEIENELPDRDSQNTAGGGLGLRNSRERLQQLYGQHSSLRASMIDNDRFLTVLTIPLVPDRVRLEDHHQGVSS
jgi:hypothetical protein